ncbi:MAG TPA: pitrilysin family protein [Blastocatellia bacterium]|nr:pitrilysin family protein [Blastocatellia bacterium]
MKHLLVASIICMLGQIVPGGPGAGLGSGGAAAGQGVGYVLPILKRDSLLNGLQMIVLEQRGTGAVTARLRINSGGLFDLATKGGLADITAGMLLRGGGGLTAKNVQEIVESSGLKINITVGWDSTDITISGPAESLDTIFDLLGRLLISPAFDEKELESLKAERIAEMKAEDKDDSQLVGRAALEAVYGSHPYGRPLRGTPESIAKIGGADLDYFHGRFYIANNSELIITGDATAEDVTRLGRAKLGAWKKGERVPATFRPPEAVGSRRLVVIDRKEAQAAHAAIAQEGVSRRASDYFAAMVMGEILSQKVSDLRGGSSGAEARTRIEARYLPGPIIVQLKGGPTEIVEKVEGVIAAMTSLRSAGASVDQVEAAKARVLNSFAERLRTTDGAAEIILDIELYGLGRDYLINFADRINAIAPADVKKAAETYLKPQSLVVVVAGPRSQIETPLKRLGAVTAMP